jgi:YVTN family beta-propeller protein
MMSGVSSPPAAARAVPHRRLRVAVVVVSVAAAIAGSVVLATRHTTHPVSAHTGGLRPGGKVVAAIPVGHATPPWRGGGPMAIGEGAVWAVGNAESTLSRIDPARNAVVKKIELDPPEEMAAGDGAVWLTYPSENTVARFDPATSKVTKTIHVGPNPEGIAVSPGAVWVANADGPSLSRIDPATNHVVATIPLGSPGPCCADHMNVAASSRAVWVAVTNRNRVVRVDPATNRVAETVATDFQQCGSLAFGKQAVWAASGYCGGDNGDSNGVVERIDAHTKATTGRLSEVFPDGLTVAFGSVWVAVKGTANVDRVDPRTARLSGRLHVGGYLARIGSGFGSIWAEDDFGRIVRIDPT